MSVATVVISVRLIPVVPSPSRSWLNAISKLAIDSVQEYLSQSKSPDVSTP